MSTRKRYTREFKLGASKMVVEQGYHYQEVAQRLEVPYHSLKEWVKVFRSTGALPPASQPKPEADELKTLRKENERLKLEVEILKKAAAYFARESL